MILLVKLALFSVIVYHEVADSAVIATKGEIWPRPLQTEKYNGYFLFSNKNFAFQVSKDSYNCTLLQQALDRYQKILKSEQNKRWDLSDDFLGNMENLTVTLQQPCDDNEYPSLEASEAYSLQITSDKTELTADTVWGIVRGLETFSQLIYLENNNETPSLRIDETKIFDQPRYQHRGFLLDTARHYIPLKQIYEILDGMAYNKLNVFHWHIVDDQSFPYVSEKYPELSAKGAYTKSQIYKPDDIKSVIERARERGIRVVPEFDTPGHTKSWGLSHPELLCEYEDEYGPMDPSKNTTYDFLNNLFGEARGIFKDKYIHLGGDEVVYYCWTANPEIVKFMENLNFHDRQDYINYYGQKIINMADNLNFSSIVWEEMFFDGVRLPKNTVVQIWRNSPGQLWTDNMGLVTAAGKKALLSACWYLSNVDRTWQDYYGCDPLDFGGTVDQAKLIIGGEACLWSEMTNEYNIVPTIFPRVSAIAQKLWSDYDSGKDLDEEANRLEEHACRMNRRGVSASPPNGPGYCE